MELQSCHLQALPQRLFQASRMQISHLLLRIMESVFRLPDLLMSLLLSLQLCLLLLRLLLLRLLFQYFLLLLSLLLPLVLHPYRSGMRSRMQHRLRSPSRSGTEAAGSGRAGYRRYLSHQFLSLQDVPVMHIMPHILHRYIRR